MGWDWGAGIRMGGRNWELRRMRWIERLGGRVGACGIDLVLRILT